MGRFSSLGAIWSPPSVSDDGHWMTGGGGVYGSGGVTVSEDMALSNPVVFDCVNILMDALVLSPAVLYDRLPDGARERSTAPLAYRLANLPNEEQTAAEFFREMQQSACFYPFAYAEIEWNGPTPRNIRPLHPSRIKVDRKNGRKQYGYLDPETNQWRPVLPADMLRVPGRPVLRYAGQTINHALMLQRYSTKLFQRGIRPSLMLATAPDDVWTPAAKDKVKAEIQAEHGGPDNAGGILMMDARLKPTTLGMTNQEAEMSALLTNMVGDLARWWRIPPYMIGLLESGTVSYASVNTQGIDFVVYCLMPWLVGWEQAMQRDLLAGRMRESMFIEFLTAALLRGTTKERYEVYEIALANGIMSPNEVRRLENLNPRPGGDTWETPTAQDRSLADQAWRVNDSPQAARLLHSFAQDAAGRVIRREQGALAKLAERTGPDPKAWEQGVKEFYSGGHAAFISDALKVPQSVASSWCDRQMWSVLADGPSAAAGWNGADSTRLAEMALNEGIRQEASL